MQRMTEVDGNQDGNQKAESAAGQQNPERHCHHRVKHQRASSSKRAFSRLRCGSPTLGASPRPRNHPCWNWPWEIGRAHVRTPVTNAHLVCRLLLEKKNTTQTTHTNGRIRYNNRTRRQTTNDTTTTRTTS